jgi:hypothetical protein
MIGDNIVFSDFCIFELLDGMNFMSNGETFKRHSNLREYFDRMTKLPGFDSYWKDDEKCMKRPFRMLDSKFIGQDGST